MNVQSGFIIILMIVCFFYMLYRLFLRREIVLLIFLAIDIFAITVASIAFFRGAYSNNLMESIYITFGIIIPCIYFIIDYSKMIKKIRKYASFEGFIEPNLDFIKPSRKLIEGKKVISNILEDLDPYTVIDELLFTKEKIVLNLKKSIIYAKACADAGDIDKAIEVYKYLLVFVKNSSAIYYNYANLCLAKEDYVEALKNYKKAIKVNDETILELNSPKEVMSIEFDDSGGEKENNEMTESDIRKNEYKIYYNMGNACYLLKEFNDAIEAYKKALELNPDIEEANDNIAFSLIAMNKYGEAIDFYEKFLGSSNDKARAYLILGKLFFEIGNYDEAAKNVSEAIKLRQDYQAAMDFLKIIYENKGNKVYMKNTYSNLNNFNDDFEDNEEDKRRYISKNKSDISHSNNFQDEDDFFISTREDNVLRLYKEAQAKIDYQDFKAAKEILENIIGIKNDFVDAYLSLGIILASQGKIFEAYKLYVQAIKVVPNDFRLYYNIGIVLNRMGKIRESVEMLSRAYRIKPDDKQIVMCYGAMLAKNRKFEDAVMIYKKALNYWSDEAEIYYALAVCNAALDDFNETIINLKQAVRLDRLILNRAERERIFDKFRYNNEFQRLFLEKE